ncbi:MAG: hypothetical protein JWP76_2699, partial [Dactylosporangium sp.]|nr:hypothetical protein [Dactylosporangium sp.]
LEPGADEPLDVTFVARDRLDNWLEDVPEAHHRFVLGLAPAAAALREVPVGYRDYIAEEAVAPRAAAEHVTRVL